MFARMGGPGAYRDAYPSIVDEFMGRKARLQTSIKRQACPDLGATSFKVKL